MEKKEKFWPLDSSGSMHPIFDKKFIDTVFTKIMPDYLKCAPSNIKKSIKAVIKKHKKSSYKKDLVNKALSNELFVEFCNDEKLRKYSSKITVQKEKLIKQGR